jgi:hypothetical protein
MASPTDHVDHRPAPELGAGGSRMRVVVAAVIIGLLVASCGSTPERLPASLSAEPSNAASSPSPDRGISSAAPETSPSRAIEPSAAPSPAATPADTQSRPRPDSFAWVVTDNLRVRSRPEVSDQSAKYEPLLWKGALLWVIEGPVRGSGYDWYRIQPMGEADLQQHPDPPPEGWVAAASKVGEPWVEDWGICPRVPLDTVSEFDWPAQGLIGLSCNGSQSIEFTAMASRWSPHTCDDSDWRRQIEPVWFQGCVDRYVLDRVGGFAQGERAALSITLAPEVEVNVTPALEIGSWVRVRVSGHYDDPRARSCRLPEHLANVSEETVVRFCRAQFVVDTLTN